MRRGKGEQQNNNGKGTSPSKKLDLDEVNKTNKAIDARNAKKGEQYFCPTCREWYSSNDPNPDAHAGH